MRRTGTDQLTQGQITLHRESKKGATLTMAITLSILDQFAKFFHCCKFLIFKFSKVKQPHT